MGEKLTKSQRQTLIAWASGASYFPYTGGDTIILEWPRQRVILAWEATVADLERQLDEARDEIEDLQAEFSI